MGQVISYLPSISYQIAAIDELTTKKKDELLRLIIMLTDTHEKTKRNIDLLERRLSAPVTLQPAVVNADLQTTQKSVADLEELLGTLGMYECSRVYVLLIFYLLFIDCTPISNKVFHTGYVR